MEVGKHCSLTLCNRLDFLPFECHLCSQIFCKDHCEPWIHKCSNYQNNELDEVRDRFTLGTHPCSFEGCMKKELTEIICEVCEGFFCFSHRNPLDHKCIRGETKSNTTSGKKYKPKAKLQPTIPKKLKSSNQRALAAKVALIKMKMSAVGNRSIPEDDRFFLNIILPDLSSKPFYFSKHWTIGRIIDYVASEMKLKNENNKFNSSSKLFVFDGFNQDISYSGESELLHINDLPNGSTLILRYVSDKAD